MNRPDVYAFYSVKGGVGKSALSIAAALGFAAQGRSVAVLDADFMGTSLGDGLALRAPELRRPDGSLQWTGPAERLLTRDETLARRRDPAKEGSGLPFLDALILDEAPSFDPVATAWQHPDQPNVRWYPSSPRVRDTTEAVRRVLFTPSAQLTRRISTVALQIADALPERPVIIIDLPPALFGVPTLTVDAFADTDQVERFVPVLVTTPDRNDLYRSIDVFFDLSRTLYDMRWILNRNLASVEEVRDEVKDYLPPPWRQSGVERQLQAVGWSGEGLGKLYQQDTLSLPERVTRLVVDLLTRGTP